mgnify:CR=1 FL=1
MKSSLIFGKSILAAVGILGSIGFAGAPAQAAPVITAVNADLSTSPFSFSFMGNPFAFSGTGSFPDYLSVCAAGGAAGRTVFGNPSTDFTDRGTAVYDQNILGGYGSFATLTTIPTTNGNNFLGLRVTSGGQNYYGFAYTTNAMLNSYGFETTANTAITATTVLPPAVPETATWAMMILGFGVVGLSLRASQRTKLSFA